MAPLQLLAEIDPHPIGWMIIALGVFTLGLAGFHNAVGLTSMENPTSFVGTPIRRDEEPAKFRMAIVSTVMAGVGCIITGAILLF
jgi:hypothetical protein